MSEQPTLNLYQRIRAVALEVTTVEKTGKTQFGQKATSIGDVENALRGPMFEHGIITHWSEPELVDISKTTASGKLMELWKARMSVTVVNADNPEEQFEDYWSDIGTNPMAATSFARKGYYKALFHLTGEEDETSQQAGDSGKGSQAKGDGKDQASNGVDAAHEKLLDQTTEALKQLSGVRKTNGKALMTEWRHVSGDKSTPFDMLNNNQLMSLRDWANLEIRKAQQPPVEQPEATQPATDDVLSF